MSLYKNKKKINKYNRLGNKLDGIDKKFKMVLLKNYTIKMEINSDKYSEKLKMIFLIFKDNIKIKIN